MQSVVAVPAAAAHDLNEELTIILNAAAAALALTELGQSRAADAEGAAGGGDADLLAGLRDAVLGEKARGWTFRVSRRSSAIEGDDYGVRHNLT